MTPRTHEAIALGPTGNLQGSVKFYCIHTGRVLKRRSFTPMPMSDHVIRQVKAIGTREGQGRAFRFLNRRGEPYEWTDEVPEDDTEFQGLLNENEDTAAYPDISAELPGVWRSRNRNANSRLSRRNQSPNSGISRKPRFTMQASTLMKPFGGRIWASRGTDQQLLTRVRANVRPP